MDSYDVHIAPHARKELRSLPGHVRQRVLRAVRALEREPRPWSSRELDTKRAGLKLEAGVELRRIRIESWRVIYTVEESWAFVAVMAIRKRPPYDYTDLAELLALVN